MKNEFTVLDRSRILRVLFFLNDKSQADVLRHFAGKKDTGAINRVVRFTNRDPEIRDAITKMLNLPKGFWDLETPIRIEVRLIVGNGADE